MTLTIPAYNPEVNWFDQLMLYAKKFYFKTNNKKVEFAYLTEDEWLQLHQSNKERLKHITDEDQYNYENHNINHYYYHILVTDIKTRTTPTINLFETQEPPKPDYMFTINLPPEYDMQDAEYVISEFYKKATFIDKIEAIIEYHTSTTNHPHIHAFVFLSKPISKNDLIHKYICPKGEFKYSVLKQYCKTCNNLQIDPVRNINYIYEQGKTKQKDEYCIADKLMREKLGVPHLITLVRL